MTCRAGSFAFARPSLFAPSSLDTAPATEPIPIPTKYLRTVRLHFPCASQKHETLNPVHRGGDSEQETSEDAKRNVRRFFMALDYDVALGDVTSDYDVTLRYAASDEESPDERRLFFLRRLQTNPARHTESNPSAAGSGTA